MKVNYKSDAAEIQYVLKKKGLTQNDIAERLEVTKGAVSKAISGNPKVKVLRKQIIDLINSLEIK